MLLIPFSSTHPLQPVPEDLLLDDLLWNLLDPNPEWALLPLLSKGCWLFDGRNFDQSLLRLYRWWLWVSNRG